MIKDFQTYINEGLFDRNQSEFNIRKTDKGIEHVYIPKTKDELCKYIELNIEQAKKEGTYPNVNLKNIDVSELRDGDLDGLFGDDFYTHSCIYTHINPDISNWNIKYIPNNFFSGNEQIEEFTISNSITHIGSHAFYGCTGLKSVTISNSVKKIENGAFAYCSSLVSIEIPDSVIYIGDYTFWECNGLKSITIPNSVTSIGSQTFGYCKSLTSIDIPDNVTHINGDAFDGCKSLTSVTVSKHCDISTNSFPENCKITRRDD